VTISRFKMAQQRKWCSYRTLLCRCT